MGQYEKSWVDVFQPEKQLRGAKDPESALLVDVGGGIGGKTTIFRRRYPHLPGRVILQELPAVIASAKEKNADLGNLVNIPVLSFRTL